MVAFCTWFFGRCFKSRDVHAHHFIRGPAVCGCNSGANRSRFATNPGSQIVKADTESGRYGGRVVTRFPPEPNGYLHVGHVKAMSLNFGIAEDFGGQNHLRFDDTNPESEDEEYVLAIQDDIRWLGEGGRTMSRS